MKVEIWKLFSLSLSESQLNNLHVVKRESNPVIYPSKPRFHPCQKIQRGTIDYSLGHVCQERNIIYVCLEEGYISNLYLHKHRTSHFSMEVIINENHYTHNNTSFPLKLSMYECMISPGMGELKSCEWYKTLKLNWTATKSFPQSTPGLGLRGRGSWIQGQVGPTHIYH